LKEFSEYSYHKGFDIFKNIDCAKNYIFSLDIKNDVFPIHGERFFYYDNGSIQAKHNYLNGKYNGEQIRYYENENIEDIENYVNGINHGIFIHNYENGNLHSETLYDMNKIVYKKNFIIIKICQKNVIKIFKKVIILQENYMNIFALKLKL
jgi:antitoxin component YwqK of YwqJK toxin-antitoxin module